MWARGQASPSRWQPRWVWKDELMFTGWWREEKSRGNDLWVVQRCGACRVACSVLLEQNVQGRGGPDPWGHSEGLWAGWGSSDWHFGEDRWGGNLGGRSERVRPRRSLCPDGCFLVGSGRYINPQTRSVAPASALTSSRCFCQDHSHALPSETLTQLV